MYLMDTMCVDPTTACYDHAYHLHAALNRQINTVFGVVKFDSRYTKMVPVVEAQLDLLGPFRHKYCLVVTHWDRCDDKLAGKKGIANLMAKVGIPGGIIFCSRDSCPAKVAEEFIAVAAAMKQEAVVLNRPEFFLKFNLVDASSAEIQQAVVQTKKSIDLVMLDCNNFIATELSAFPIADRDGVLHGLLVWARTYILCLIDSFTASYGAAMVEMDRFTFHIDAKSHGFSCLRKLEDEVGRRMRYKLTDSTCPLNMIKRCPYCGLVWAKVEGCDGATTCGNRVSEAVKVDAPTSFFSFDFSFSSLTRKLGFKKKETPKTREAVKVPIVKGGMGCGKQLIWGQLPRLTEAELQTFFQVATVDSLYSFFDSMEATATRQAHDSKLAKEQKSFKVQP